MSVLKLDKDDPEREIEFELAYLRSLTVAERFSLMRRRSDEIARQLFRHGHRRAFEIVKRP
ncbi:MAG: hypothetical protein V1809_11625 [Planctomycetota bacterium]